MSATSSQNQPSQATGPRAMAEQSILRIIWPPDGRPAWEDRHKIPRIEQALGALLDIVEGDDVKPAAIKARESQKLTAQVLELRRQGLTMAQVAEVTGLTEYAVIHRISNSKKAQTDVKTPAEEPFSCHHENGQGEPAALRSAAPDHIVEANDMVSDAVLVGPRPAENPTIRGTLEILEGHVEPTQREDGKEWAKIPHAFDNQIIDLKKGGKTYPEISEVLQQQGINCTEKDVGNRIFRLRKQGALIEVGKERLSSGQRPVEAPRTVTQKDDTSFQPQKDVMLLQQPANVADTSAASKPVEEKPAAKAIGRAELDARIWTLWKEGKSPAEISDIIWDEGYYYNEKSVVIRLRSQGADI